MTSINKIILVGNLGRVSRSALDTVGRQSVDAYLDVLHGYVDAISSHTFYQAARRLAEAFRALRRVAGPIALRDRIAAPSMPLFGRNAAFFHAGKVDARNHP